MYLHMSLMCVPLTHIHISDAFKEATCSLDNPDLTMEDHYGVTFSQPPMDSLTSVLNLFFHFLTLQPSTSSVSLRY